MTKPKLDSAWYGFLVIVFLVAGLAGIFGTYAIQVPYQRGEAQQQLIDRIAQDPAQLSALKDELGATAAPLSRADLSSDQRIVAARALARAATIADGADIAARLRVLITVITLGCTLFGCVLMGAAASQRKP